MSGKMRFKGLWNASTNSPTLADGTGTVSDTWLVSTGAARSLGSGSLTFAAGDYAFYDGSIWKKYRIPKAMVEEPKQ